MEIFQPPLFLRAACSLATPSVSVSLPNKTTNSQAHHDYEYSTCRCASLPINTLVFCPRRSNASPPPPDSAEQTIYPHEGIMADDRGEKHHRFGDRHSAAPLDFAIKGIDSTCKATFDEASGIQRSDGDVDCMGDTSTAPFTNRKRQRNRSCKRVQMGLWGGKGLQPDRNGMGSSSRSVSPQSPLRPVPNSTTSNSSSTRHSDCDSSNFVNCAPYRSSDEVTTSCGSSSKASGSLGSSSSISTERQKPIINTPYILTPEQWKERDRSNTMAEWARRGYDEELMRLMDESVHDY